MNDASVIPHHTDKWRMHWPCHVTAERIRRVHAILRETDRNVRIQVTSTGSNAPFDINISTLIECGTYGRLKSLHLSTSAVQVSLRDDNGPSAVITWVSDATATTKQIISEVSKWRNINQVPSNRTLVISLVLATLLVPIGINAYSEYREREQLRDELARILAAQRKDESNGAIEPDGPRGAIPEAMPSRRAVPSAAVNVVMILAATASGMLLFQLLRPFMFLLASIVDMALYEYAKLFPVVWFDFPGCRGDYRSDGARWSAIAIGATTCVWAFGALLAAR